jgi:hypothetical protein
LLGDLEPHLCRIIVTAGEIVDRDNQTLHRRKLRRHGERKSVVNVSMPHFLGK